jgi:hypothetical protein
MPSHMRVAGIRRMTMKITYDMLTKDELLEQYEVLGFVMGYCAVRRKADGVEGVFSFSNIDGIRYYHTFEN